MYAFYSVHTEQLLRRLNCVETDTRNALRSTCPVCNNLFQAKSELCDRRPLVACLKSDTICADCCNECRKRSSGKCPVCGDDLLPTPVVDKTLTNLIENCVVSLLDIPLREIKIEKEPFERGGFAKVYEATWQQKIVVIKIIEAFNDEEKKNIECEASLTLRLRHTNVIELFGITRRKRNIGIVMEKAEHGSLDKCIGMIDHEKLTKIALGIIDGLEYVHSQKVIHRDIKPKNILMCGPKDDMIPKIADFGVSKVIERTTINSQRGSDIYMAPEVRTFNPYGLTADIFSLAMTLFEMFNEQILRLAPVEVKSFINGVHTLQIGEFPQSCKVPMHLRGIIVRGWNREPAKRPKLDEYRSALRGKTYIVLTKYLAEISQTANITKR